MYCDRMYCDRMYCDHVLRSHVLRSKISRVSVLPKNSFHSQDMFAVVTACNRNKSWGSLSACSSDLEAISPVERFIPFSTRFSPSNPWQPLLQWYEMFLFPVNLVTGFVAFLDFYEPRAQTCFQI
jgi:hypothetical protein